MASIDKQKEINNSCYSTNKSLKLDNYIQRDLFFLMYFEIVAALILYCIEY